MSPRTLRCDVRDVDCAFANRNRQLFSLTVVRTEAEIQLPAVSRVMTGHDGVVDVIAYAGRRDVGRRCRP